MNVTTWTRPFDNMKPSRFRKEILRAISDGEFQMYFQPQISVSTNKLFGAESLIRWHHPEYGIIFPNAFIPRAEEEGLISVIGKWTLSSVIKQQYVWQAKGLPITNIAVNIGAEHMKEEDFPVEADKILERFPVPAELVVLEITERQKISIETWTSLTNKLSRKGYRFSVDDFGTGFNSLATLSEAQIDFVKIDMAFVKRLKVNKRSGDIIRSIIFLADKLGFYTIAEGVENAEQYNWLRKSGVHAVQGFFFDPALIAEEFEAKYLSRTSYGDSKLAE